MYHWLAEVLPHNLHCPPDQHQSGCEHFLDLPRDEHVQGLQLTIVVAP